MVLINSDLYKRSMWMNKNIDYLFGSEIVEYDMQSAGLNLSKEYKLLPENTLKKLSEMKKEARVVKMGLLQRKDKEYANKLKEAFSEARKWFLEENELTEDKILSIKKDAIFVIDSPVVKQGYGHVLFRPKNRYSTFLKLNKLEFYINTKIKIIDIKGLGQDKDLEDILSLHREYILKFILKFASMRERLVDNRTFTLWLTRFIKDYREKNLPMDYYRELSRSNAYDLFDETLGKMIQVRDTDQFDKIVINYNYINYVLPLVSLIL